MQSIDLIEAYAYRTSKGLSEKEETKCSNIIKQYKKWIVFDDMLSSKKLNPVVIDLFVRGKKLNICFVFITQSYFAVPKNIRLNSTH